MLRWFLLRMTCCALPQYGMTVIDLVLKFQFTPDGDLYANVNVLLPGVRPVTNDMPVIVCDEAFPLPVSRKLRDVNVAAVMSPLTQKLISAWIVLAIDAGDTMAEKKTIASDPVEATADGPFDDVTQEVLFDTSLVT